MDFNFDTAFNLFDETINSIKNPPNSILVDDFKLLNQVTGGFRGFEYSILCGPTGCGKTQFLANLSLGLIKSNIKHFVMSVETGKHDFFRRVFSAFSKYDYNTGAAADSFKVDQDAKKFIPVVSSDSLYLSHYESRVKVENLIKDLIFMNHQRGCKLAIIDNLNFFMEVTSAANQIVEMDRVTHELIMLCKRIDIHIIMVMHPKKTDHGRVENEFDIKGSSTSVQEAHNVFLFNKPSQVDITNGKCRTDRELKIVKMRRRGLFVGRSLWFTADNGSVYLEKGIE